MGLLLRPETPDDHEVIRSVVAAAFGSDSEADLVDRIRASPEYVAELALVAEEDGEVVGHVMISGAVVRRDPAPGDPHAGAAGGPIDQPIKMLSPLAVRPDRQGQGIGGTLVRGVTAAADKHGEPLVILEGAPAYYSRFGFRPASELRLTLPIPDWAPPEAAQYLALTSFDSDRFTQDGKVVYPAAFDGLD